MSAQVVAELLEEQLGTAVYARRYAPGGYSWKQHLADAADPSRLLHSLIGPGGGDAWDHVVFQVCLLQSPCTVLVLRSSRVRWVLCRGVSRHHNKTHMMPGEPVQEQSQALALGREESEESLKALEGLVRLARSRGARITLLMTWAYKEGDPAQHRAIFPDYTAMQASNTCSIVGRGRACVRGFHKVTAPRCN